MANQEQLDILRQGVDHWNKWREKHKTTEIDLRDANLREANLYGINLLRAKLSRAKLNRANLTYANLNNANLSRVDLREACLLKADLSGANLHEADLHEANLHEANLSEADLSDASFSDADLTSAHLIGSNLFRANFSRTDFTSANIGITFFTNIDFSEALGVEQIHHELPSTIGMDTIQLSKGKISDAFLRGCGLSDIEIEFAKIFNPDLTNEEIVKIQYRIYDLRATQALQISPLFISYSHADSTFVNKLETCLNEKGVRFWRDIHDATAGRLETQIDRAIRQNPTVLLILSKNSINSDWVQHEVRKARDLEKELVRDVLCPIALDDSWKSSPWPQRIMEQVMEYNILDFSGWEKSSIFEFKFAKLLSGLDLFYKKT